MIEPAEPFDLSEKNILVTNAGTLQEYDYPPGVEMVVRKPRPRRKRSGIATVVNQSAYRWRNDDGSETTATWAANENVDLTAGKDTNKRLRVQLDAQSGDPASAQHKLQYRKVGSSTGVWHDVND